MAINANPLAAPLEGLPGERDAAGHLVGELPHHRVLLLARPVLRALEEASQPRGPHAGHELRGHRGRKHVGLRKPREPQSCGSGLR